MSGPKDKEDLKTLNNTLESLIIQLREGGDGGRHGFLVRQTKIIALQSDSSVQKHLTQALEDHIARLEQKHKVGDEAPDRDENERLKASALRLIEENAAYAAETERLRLSKENYNARLERENEELRKRLTQKDLKPEIKRREMELERKSAALKAWQERHKHWVLNTKEVKVSAFGDVKIEELKTLHEQEIKRLKERIKELQDEALKIESKILEEIFVKEYSAELERIRKEKDEEQEKLEKQVKFLEMRLAKYKVNARLRLTEIQDAELSLRWQIKAYELLVATECKRLGIPPPKITPQKMKFAVFEVQKAKGHHEVEVRNLTVAEQPLKGYKLVTEKGAWKFPDGVKLASGANIGIVISVGGPGYTGGGKLLAHLEFAQPLDTISLINSSGTVECEETVFSDSLD